MRSRARPLNRGCDKRAAFRRRRAGRRNWCGDRLLGSEKPGAQIQAVACDQQRHEQDRRAQREKLPKTFGANRVCRKRARERLCDGSHRDLRIVQLNGWCGKKAGARQRSGGDGRFDRASSRLDTSPRFDSAPFCISDGWSSSQPARPNGSSRDSAPLWRCRISAGSRSPYGVVGTAPGFT